MGAYYGNLASLKINGGVWVCPQGEMDGDYFNVVAAILHGTNGSTINYDIALAPGPNCIARAAGAGPPSSYGDNNPAAANTNHFELWIDDRPGSGDGDFNDIGFDVQINGDGTATIKNLIKNAGDSFDILDAETGAVLAKNVGGGSNVNAVVAGGRASYGLNTLADYNKLSTKIDKIIALDYYSGGARPGADREADWKRDKSGAPRFARHNKKINILFNDSSVKQVDWITIDFFRSFPVIAKYWDVPASQ
jgi:prepilin-type processing-associated H-X9-DG protein